MKIGGYSKMRVLTLESIIRLVQDRVGASVKVVRGEAPGTDYKFIAIVDEAYTGKVSAHMDEEGDIEYDDNCADDEVYCILDEDDLQEIESDAPYILVDENEFDDTASFEIDGSFVEYEDYEDYITEQ